MALVRTTPLGVLDTDTDLNLLREGNYPDAHDIRMQNLGVNQGTKVTNIKGNALKVTIPSAQSSFKKYRFYIDTKRKTSGGIGEVASGTVTLIDSGLPGGSNQASFTVDQDHVINFYTDFVTQFQALIDAGFYNPDDPFIISALTQTSSDFTTGYFDVTQNAVIDNDFTLSHVGTLLSKIELITEYVASASDEELTFKPVGSGQIGTDLFVLSVTTHEFSFGRIGELGVQVYDENTDTYTYTRLFRKNNWGLHPDFQAQIVGDINNERVSVYWTDRNDKPKAIYVDKPYIEDGALSANGGLYSYETAIEETYYFIKQPNATITVNSVNEGSGQLPIGNKRYTGRFLTDALVSTEILFPTNPVPVYIGTQAIPWEIAGGDIGEVSDKSISLIVSNIPQGIFKYFELICIDYRGDTFSSYIVRRYALDDTGTLNITHTGIGEDNTALAVTELLAEFIRYEKVGSLGIINSRMVLSDLKEEVDPDLSGWAQTIEHSLEAQELDTVGFQDLNTDDQWNYKYGEYQNPLNVYSFAGYMFNDTYRFGIEVKWKESGRWSRPYWVDDIRFDLEATNVVGSRRTANNINSNITNAGGETLYSYYLNFSNIDLDKDADGLSVGPSVGSQIEAYRFVRSERIPEVLATGLFVVGRSNGGGVITPENIGSSSSGSPLLATGTDESDYLFFYSPDLILGKKQYSYTSGDKINILGEPEQLANNNVQKDSSYKSVHTEMGGEVSALGDKEYDQYNILGHLRMAQGATGELLSRDLFNGQLHNLTSSGGFLLDGTPIVAIDGVFFNEGCEAFKISTALLPVYSSGLHTAMGGFLYGQIFRDLGANTKYPLNKELTVYVSVGHIRIIDPNDLGIKNDDIFGGDVFNQKTHVLMTTHAWVDPVVGGGQGFAMYTQNTINSQMRWIAKDETIYGWQYPQYTYDWPVPSWKLAYWLQQWPAVSKQLNYHNGYSIDNGVITQQGFDSSSTYDGSRPATLAYSPVKTQNSLKDNFRVFKPADIYDLDLNQGPISFHAAINGLLYTWQRDSFRGHYFGQASLIGTAEGTDIIVGAGGIFSSPGREISSVGADKKWSIIIGKSPAGKDTAYWYNHIQHKIVRFAGDGVDVISDSRKVSSFIKNKTLFLQDKDEPITNYGVNGVWNDRYDEVIFTFKAISSEIQEFVPGDAYETGDLVKNLDADTHYSGLPFIYKAKSNFLGTPDNRFPGTGDDTDDYWDELGPEDLPEYYTLFTIVFSERFGGFRCFHQYFPNLYMPHLNSFLTTNPLVTKTIYLHDSGPYTTYYGVQYEGSITGMVNIDPNVIKVYEAIQVLSDIIPYRFEFETREHDSIISASDFVTREDHYYAPILNDNDGNGVYTLDTGRLRGRYLKAKMIFAPAVLQGLTNFITKFRPSNRLYNR